MTVNMQPVKQKCIMCYPDYAHVSGTSTGTQQVTVHIT